MANRSMKNLDPKARPYFESFEESMKAVGIKYTRICIWRSNIEQKELYAAGREKAGRIMTNHKPGCSPHNLRSGHKPASRAIDYHPIVNGKLATQHTEADLEVWALMGRLADMCGITWGGNWDGAYKDRTHFEWRETGIK